jgi:Arc/MetJ family transcription regulator
MLAHIRYGRKYGHMKTTIELDDEKLVRIMDLTGLKTRKEAVDWALTEALRIANIDRIAEEPWDAEFLKEAVEPGYDILEMRRQPVKYTRGK